MLSPHEIKRVELVRAAKCLLGDSFGFHVACLLEKVTEYILQGQNDTSHSHLTIDGTIQGDVYSTLLACLVLIRAQNEFLSIMKCVYPNFTVVGAPSADFDLSRLPEQLHHLVNRLPSEEEVFADVCEHRQRKGISRFLMNNVTLSLRSYIDDMTWKCPSLLSEFSFATLNNRFLPIGVAFRPQKKQSAGMRLRNPTVA